MVTTKARFLKEYPAALREGTGGIFVGAGVSMAAGYPSWRELLQDIGDELGVRSSDVHDLAALAQWSVRASAGYTQIRQVIRNEIGRDRPVPPAVQTIARLPVRHIWTTNYDRLIERAFEGVGRPVDTISSEADLAIRGRPGAARLYKIHGSVDRLDDVVISTDDYELFRSKRGAFLPLLQAHLTSMSMLFVGLSFTDPNVRHVLSLIRESFIDGPPEHFALIRPPQRTDYSTAEEYEARARQHTLWSDDLLRYGLRAVEIEQYDEVPELLAHVERRVAASRVWVSGSWPLGPVGQERAEFVHAVAEGIGRGIGDFGMSLVSGAGLLVGSASMAGFLSSLQQTGSWDLERRLIVRPFPQRLDNSPPNRQQWTLLRQELARVSGAVVFVGGVKVVGGRLVEADGVHQEAELARARGAFLLPVGATGGASKSIASHLLGGDLPATGPEPGRPTDDELVALSDETKSADELVELALKVLKRVRL